MLYVCLLLILSKEHRIICSTAALLLFGWRQWTFRVVGIIHAVQSQKKGVKINHKSGEILENCDPGRKPMKNGIGVKRKRESPGKTVRVGKYDYPFSSF